MKEHSYQYKPSKAVLKSIPIWSCLVIQLFLSASVILDGGTAMTLVLINLFLSIIWVPGVILHLNHLKYTKKAKLILRDDTISLINQEEEICLNNADVDKIILHKASTNFRLPWLNYSWFELIDKDGQSIKVSSYLLDISDFWQDTLSHKVSSKKMSQEVRFFPMIK